MRCHLAAAAAPAFAVALEAWVLSRGFCASCLTAACPPCRARRFAGKDEADQIEKIFAIMGQPTEANMPGCSKYEK